MSHYSKDWISTLGYQSTNESMQQNATNCKIWDINLNYQEINWKIHLKLTERKFDKKKEIAVIKNYRWIYSHLFLCAKFGGFDLIFTAHAKANKRPSLTFWTTPNPELGSNLCWITDGVNELPGTPEWSEWSTFGTMQILEIFIVRPYNWVDKCSNKFRPYVVGPVRRCFIKWINVESFPNNRCLIALWPYWRCANPLILLSEHSMILQAHGCKKLETNPRFKLFPLENWPDLTWPDLNCFPSCVIKICHKIKNSPKLRIKFTSIIKI